MSRTPTPGSVPQPDGTLKLHFAVENPSGISARALAAILGQDALAGLPPEEVARVSPEIVEQHLPSVNISMGKGMGLMSMVLAVQTLAKTAWDALAVANKPGRPD